ncbi:MAG: pyruvate ferredoxin oxidoreductase, partial [Oscillospiraceae bacterium]|nr:pyruvate ferredoxin oxidoreductase [Oscillospiraceae bacterium]
MRTVLTGNYAVSYGVKLVDVQVVSAYPITPQTQIVEKLSEMCAKGELNAKYINVESEHSAMASCIGAASTGARVFTATSSQGLVYMHELLHWSSRARLPIVMANVNRALAPGWNVWVDQNDSLSQRDTGWMQIYCKDNQEVLDSIIMAYKISEKVSLPTMVNLDAFVLSHTSEIVDVPDIEKVRKFLPSRNPEMKMDIDDPHTFGTLTSPEYYSEFQYKIQKSMEQAETVIAETCKEFEELFGRSYAMLESYKMDDATEVIITTSTMAETATIAVDALREQGSTVGALRIRYLRPFPANELYARVKGKNKIIVLDRNISFGAQGIFCQEVRAALYGKADIPQISGFVLGLGGRDVRPENIIDIYNKE